MASSMPGHLLGFVSSECCSLATSLSSLDFCYYVIMSLYFLIFPDMLIFFCFYFIWLFLNCLVFWLQIWNWGVPARLMTEGWFFLFCSCHSKIVGQPQVAVTKFSGRRKHLLGPKCLQKLQGHSGMSSAQCF